jgi:hypothetical protein
MAKISAAEFERLREKVKSSQIGYLLTDLEMGSTFARMAMESSREKRVRTTREARIAYDTVLRFSSKIALIKAEQEYISEQLAALKSKLQILGETF